MHGQRVGYIRVSRFDQNPERQLEHVSVDRVFTDTASGKDTRPQPNADRLSVAARLTPARCYLPQCPAGFRRGFFSSFPTAMIASRSR